MSCYLRQLKGIFDEAGIDLNTGNRKQIDQAIHQLVGTDYKDCPGTWRKIKQEILVNEEKRQNFIVKLRSTIKNIQ